MITSQYQNWKKHFWFYALNIIRISIPSRQACLNMSRHSSYLLRYLYLHLFCLINYNSQYVTVHPTLTFFQETLQQRKFLINTYQILQIDSQVVSKDVRGPHLNGDIFSSLWLVWNVIVTLDGDQDDSSCCGLWSNCKHSAKPVLTSTSSNLTNKGVGIRFGVKSAQVLLFRTFQFRQSDSEINSPLL